MFDVHRRSCIRNAQVWDCTIWMRQTLSSLFYFFYSHRRKAFCSIICELNVSLAHLPSSMEHAHTRLKNRFSRGKCFTYLRFFLSIKDRLFALSSGRKKKKTVDRRIVDFPIFHGCFRIATHVCTLYNGYLCFV